MVVLLLLAHERGCKAELANLIDADRSASRLLDMTSLRTWFTPNPASPPETHVRTVPIAAYQDLIDEPGVPSIASPSAQGQEQVA